MRSESGSTASAPLGFAGVGLGLVMGLPPSGLMGATALAAAVTEGTGVGLGNALAAAAASEV